MPGPEAGAIGGIALAASLNGPVPVDTAASARSSGPAGAGPGPASVRPDGDHVRPGRRQVVWGGIRAWWLAGAVRQWTGSRCAFGGPEELQVRWTGAICQARPLISPRFGGQQARRDRTTFVLAFGRHDPTVLGVAGDNGVSGNQIPGKGRWLSFVAGGGQPALQNTTISSVNVAAVVNGFNPKRWVVNLMRRGSAPGYCAHSSADSDSPPEWRPESS